MLENKKLNAFLEDFIYAQKIMIRVFFIIESKINVGSDRCFGENHGDIFEAFTLIRLFLSQI